MEGALVALFCGREAATGIGNGEWGIAKANPPFLKPTPDPIPPRPLFRLPTPHSPFPALNK